MPGLLEKLPYPIFQKFNDALLFEAISMMQIGAKSIKIVSSNLVCHLLSL